ncbi:hypothetical protein NX722_15770 [Endozoicomonas gorgoniicola]|uniref:DUF1266 domain-containing protein n=1 Tax=Endozoicomonas gorgoniicola TaxID=1234144 RepID=A0ABT3MXG8_9GAMM|nr:hypothetical protein [Endozoicomonas gorgoniicola]MCW7554050.1 hypothetical protein [Endozoicomonas gorgoniicola]
MNTGFPAKGTPGVEIPVCVGTIEEGTIEEGTIEEGNSAEPSSSGVENSRFKKFASIKGTSVYNILKKGTEDDFAFPREHIHAGLRLPERIIINLDDHKFNLGTYLEWMEADEAKAQLKEISETYTIKIKKFTNNNIDKLWAAVVKFDDLINRKKWQEEFLKKEGFYSYLCENKKTPRLGYEWLDSIRSEMKKDNEFAFLLGLWVEISIMTALETKHYDTAGGNIYFDWEAFDKEIDKHSPGMLLIEEPDSEGKTNKRKSNMPSGSEPADKKAKTDSVDVDPDIENEGTSTQYGNRLFGRSLSREIEASMELLDGDLYLSDDSGGESSEIEP